MGSSFAEMELSEMMFVDNAMDHPEFDNIFSQLQTPVLACNADNISSVAYMNGRARMIFAPHLSIEELQGKTNVAPLGNVVRFRNRALFDGFCNVLNEKGMVEPLQTEVLSYHGEDIPVQISAAHCRLGEKDYRLVFVSLIGDVNVCETSAGLMSMILEASAISSIPTRPSRRCCRLPAATQA